MARGSRDGERHAIVFYSAEIHGTLEPCGCTSDPLGDFARVTALVRRAAGPRRAAILVDAGALAPVAADSGRATEVARLRTEFLATELAKLPLGGLACGETDLARVPGEIHPKRLAANIAHAPFVEPSRIVDVGSIRIGVLGIVDPEAVSRLGLEAGDPVDVAAREVAQLRASGAEVVILLAPVERPVARILARGAGADFVVVGKGVGGGMPNAERVGDSYLVAPAEELERVGRLDIVLRTDGTRSVAQPLVDAGSIDRSNEAAAQLDRSIRQLESDIARWQQDADTDPAFAARKSAELSEVKAQRKTLQAGKWQPPSTGSYFTNVLIPIRRSLPRDPLLAVSMRSLDRAVGAANLKAAEPPQPAEPGRPFYVGGDKCVSCHKPAQKFWRKTMHAKAWKTLVQVGKDAHTDCVSCHATGFGEVGGSSLGHTKGLEDVQCEVCHGPGSTHVEKRGKESPFAGKLQTPESVCVRCHNEKHSDTFQYEAYLREVIGEGHGEDARDKLGEGPTGQTLRRAAMSKARTRRSSEPGNKP